jgi:hypothetical protein
MSTPGGEEPEQSGVSVLIEFLTCLLDMAGRAWEQRFRSRGQQDPEAELRGEIRQQVLQVMFVETALIPHLFQLFLSGVAPFESAALLRAILTHASSPQRCLASFVEPLLGQFLPNVELLGTILLRSTPKAAGGLAASGSLAARGGSRKQRELRLNAYTVKEPLGALRVTAVQIIAALVDLSPERTLIAIKPVVWTLLVQWFFAHRCNHIFHAACSRLLVGVVQHGSLRLQQLVLSKLKLVSGICETVLIEGACGDRWDELRLQSAATGDADASSLAGSAGARIEKSQVAVSQKRHPGGLGGMTPVIAALVKIEKSVADEVAAGSPLLSPAANRQPLAPRALPQLASQMPSMPEDGSGVCKQTGPMFIAKLLAESPSWPQVVSCVGRKPSDARGDSVDTQGEPWA